GQGRGGRGAVSARGRRRRASPARGPPGPQRGTALPRGTPAPDRPGCGSGADGRTGRRPGSAARGTGRGGVSVIAERGEPVYLLRDPVGVVGFAFRARRAVPGTGPAGAKRRTDNRSRIGEGRNRPASPGGRSPLGLPPCLPPGGSVRLLPGG